MNLKKLKIISTISIFIISALCHFIYDIFPNFITSIFFPVNESIFEHQKMILTSFLLWSIIEYFILKKIKHNNFFIALLISSLICIIFVTSVFSPIYLVLLNKKDNMLITLIVFFIGIILSQIASYYILKSKRNYNKVNIISLIIYICLIISFAYLTYNPIKNDLFFDFVKKKYGI